MFRFLLKRLALTIPTFLALMFITFVMIRLVPAIPWKRAAANAASRPSAMPSCCMKWAWTSRVEAVRRLCRRHPEG